MSWRRLLEDGDLRRFTKHNFSLTVKCEAKPKAFVTCHVILYFIFVSFKILTN